jgi:FixJ family two-component response regulator
VFERCLARLFGRAGPVRYAVATDGQTNKEIADALGLSEKTVRNMMTDVMEKLGVQQRAQAAAWFARHAEGNERWSGG